jgi:hypothetical protein
MSHGKRMETNKTHRTIFMILHHEKTTRIGHPMDILSGLTGFEFHPEHLRATSTRIIPCIDPVAHLANKRPSSRRQN